MLTGDQEFIARRSSAGGDAPSIVGGSESDSRDTPKLIPSAASEMKVKQ